MGKITRRALLLGTGGVAGYALGKTLKPDLPSLAGTTKIPATTTGSILNDASGLSATPVHKHITLTDNYRTTLADSVRAALKESLKSGLPLNVGAARHSMGGQAIPRDGLALTFANSSIEIDSGNKLYRVHAGARWSDVIAALDPQGWSPKVTQSNHDFGVAATYSVNAHGWAVPFGPMGSTVRSIRMIMPSGEQLECTRDKNADLFKHAMGGYGLIGVITDLDVEMVRNTRLIPSYQLLSAEDFATEFKTQIQDSTVTMAYGRLNVEREKFFRQALLVSYRESDNQQNLPAASSSGFKSHYASRIYRAQLGNEMLKSFRWWNETVVGPRLGGGEATRNSLINEPVATLDDRNVNRTDILHEYFIGFDRFEEFLVACREVIPASYQEFLNVTLRYIATDADSTLSYAPVARIAAVMSFSQEMTQRAEADMQRLTERLIDRLLQIDGSYYLPYRPHATVEQFASAYPHSTQFVSAKKSLDPNLVLRNNLWDTYLSKL